MALTSLVMKTFEKSVKDALLDSVQHKFDPFSLPTRRAQVWMMRQGHFLIFFFRHLEWAMSLVRLLFIDFFHMIL